ncbi:hypothetical protein CUS_6600 [Ruminococcus albus 8]|uniref:Uncharacterized protein n=1 Tax=Ruminococcus albus 8 TaxID=246199 RepID=E9SBC7_RUMAL|nr:hypothetical protein CUS_6600 [Ruminococcus albus 8]
MGFVTGFCLNFKADCYRVRLTAVQKTENDRAVCGGLYGGRSSEVRYISDIYHLYPTSFYR